MNWIMDKKAHVKSLFLTSSIFILLIFSGVPITLGHSFTSNESAVFLALIDAIIAEAQLVQENLANNSISLASEHANRASALFTESVNDEIAERNQRLADDLSNSLTTLKSSTESSPNASTTNDIDLVVGDLDAILEEIVSARIDPDQLDNSTIQALTIVELLDKVLTNYGDAYEVGFDMTNMSMMMMGNNSNGMNSMSSMEMDGSSSSNMSMPNTSPTEGSDLVNITSYQTAQVLAKKVQELFNSQLTNASDDSQSSDNIATALQELVNTIDNKSTPMDVMSIVHTKIHPNFINAFGLQLG